jgi:hypothetical protein
MDTENSPNDGGIHGTEGTHHFENANVTVSDGNAWFESKAYKSILALCRIGVFVVAIGSFCFGAYLYQRDTNAQTGVSVNDIAREQKEMRTLIDDRKRERDTQFNDLKNSTVSTVQFRAEFDALNKRLDRIEMAIDRMQTTPR